MPSRLMIPVLVLHTTRRNGTACHTPLLAGTTPSGALMVMATNFGRLEHPAWSHHLLHRPQASMTWRGKTLPVEARLMTIQEQHTAQEYILACMPCFHDYAKRSHRDIRIFILTPLP
ncbi:nitroreductase/quinone reductase family protein [Streptomyces sp. NPDC093982]|uniref:nitroreductase/quinone reductase family protein n=1 Tax=Streptomyces sp. NPDC093982 TaxID=3155077 RepID=UPI003448F112